MHPPRSRIQITVALGLAIASAGTALPAQAQDASTITASFEAYGPSCSYSWRIMQTRCMTLVRNAEGWVSTSDEPDGEGVREAMAAAAEETAARLNGMAERGEGETIALITSAAFCEEGPPHPLCEAHGIGEIPERSATFEVRGPACGETHCGALIINDLGQGAALIRSREAMPEDALREEIDRLLESYNAHAETSEGMRGYSLDVCARGGPVCERFADE